MFSGMRKDSTFADISGIQLDNRNDNLIPGFDFFPENNRIRDPVNP